jgi:hypothetical protein
MSLIKRAIDRRITNPAERSGKNINLNYQIGKKK